jgi:hypothetical protein
MSEDQYGLLVRLVGNASAESRVEVEHLGGVMKWFKFDFCDGEYGWIAERSWANCGSVGYIHPMKNSNYVKTFKTLSGAKRNFLNYWKPTSQP